MSSADIAVLQDPPPAEFSSLLATQGSLSIRQYPYLARWLSWIGVDGTKHKGFFHTYIAPATIPIVFFTSSALQDVFCYTKYSGCVKPGGIYGPSNVTYNDKTIFIWVGILVGIVALHVNMLVYARSGKLEKLFNQVSLTYDHSRTLQHTILGWAIAWAILVFGALVASFVYIFYMVGTGSCTHRYYLVCMVPQTVQIVSGTSIIFTGVGLTFIKCTLLRLYISQQAEPHTTLIKNTQFREYITELDNLRMLLKNVSKDTQVGNAIGLSGGFLCIFASVWTFAEEYSSNDNSLPIGFSISIWTLILSMILTFIALFSFSYVTKACDRLKETTRDCVLGCIMSDNGDKEVSLSECFVIITIWERRFGFWIAGLLMQPEVIRALATAGGTLAVTIVKLVISG